MRAFLLIIVLLVLVAVGRLLFVMVPASGALADLEPKLVENCSRVDVHPGTEDVTIDPATNIAYVSAYDRRAVATDDSVEGGIYAFSLDGAPTAQLVSTDAPDGFRPHGISLWTDADGTKRLFAISHPADGSQVVEIFDVTEDGLTHVKGVSFDEMYSPNDVAAVGREAFYATNDRGYREGILATLEAYLALSFSGAVYWDGAEGRTVVMGLTYANGINVSADGDQVYIAEFLGREVNVYDRDANTGDLTLVREIDVDTGADNIEIGGDGSLYVGAHPAVFDFLAHAADASEVAPSQVIRVDPETGETEDVFVATDGTISGSSVGAVHDGKLVVGAVFDGHVLVCPLE